MKDLRVFLQQLNGGILYNYFPEWSIKRDFQRCMGYPLDLNKPRTYNEKLQWLKLYWRDKRIYNLVDKSQVRNYIKQKGLEHILINLLGTYDDVEEIDIETLPEKFILKTTHGSGWNVICRDKDHFPWRWEKKRLKRWLKMNYYYEYGEWGYKNIKPKIICEELIETKDGKPPKDYKVFCFDGIPKFLFVASDRMNHKTKFDFYDCDWNWLPVKNHYPNNGDILPRPELLPQILEIARDLSMDFPHVRVDLYVENGKIYFGELTFFHFSGLQPFEPFEFDMKFGEYLHLPKKE